MARQLNNIVLFPKENFKNSLNGDEIVYGTKTHPFVSYGSYKIQEGYNPEKWTFIKNNLYEGDNTLNPKSIELISCSYARTKRIIKKNIN